MNNHNVPNYWEQELDEEENFNTDSNCFLQEAETNLDENYSNHYYKCTNKMCQINYREVKKLDEEIMNLEKKCFLIENQKYEQLTELSKKRIEVTKKRNELEQKILLFQEENLLNTSNYDNLSFLENNLLNIYSNIRNKISKVNQLYKLD
jgi:hypothetical protein